MSDQDFGADRHGACDAPGSVPHRLVWVCSTCEQVHRAVFVTPCPYCDSPASAQVLWSSLRLDPPPPDGTWVPTYEGLEGSDQAGAEAPLVDPEQV